MGTSKWHTNSLRTAAVALLFLPSCQVEPGSPVFDAKSTFRTVQWVDALMSNVQRAERGQNALAAERLRKQAREALQGCVGRRVHWEAKVKAVTAEEVIVDAHGLWNLSSFSVTYFKSGAEVMEPDEAADLHFQIGSEVPVEVAMNLRQNHRVLLHGRIDEARVMEDPDSSTGSRVFFVCVECVFEPDRNGLTVLSF